MLKRGGNATLRTAQPNTHGVVITTCRAAFAVCNLLSSYRRAFFVSKSLGHPQINHLTAPVTSTSTRTNMHIEDGVPRAVGIKPVQAVSARPRCSACRSSRSCKTWLHTSISSSSTSCASSSAPPAAGPSEPCVNWNLGERPAAGATAAAAGAADHDYGGGATAAAVATTTAAAEEAVAVAMGTTAMTLQEYITLGPYRLQQQQQRRPQSQSTSCHKKKSTAAAGAGAGVSPALTSSPPSGPAEGLIEGELEDWLAASMDLAASLGIDPATSTEPQRRRVFHLYLPVYFWLRHLLATRPLPTLSPPTTLSRSCPLPPPALPPSALSPRPLLVPPSDDSPGAGAAAEVAAAGAVEGAAAGVAAAATAAAAAAAAAADGGDRRRNGGAPLPLVVGISAPQGCGKSTLVGEMRRMLERAGHSCAVASIDDFYLTGEEQVSSRFFFIHKSHHFHLPA